MPAIAEETVVGWYEETLGLRLRDDRRWHRVPVYTGAGGHPPVPSLVFFHADALDERERAALAAAGLKQVVFSDDLETDAAVLRGRKVNDISGPHAIAGRPRYLQFADAAWTTTYLVDIQSPIEPGSA
jgi:hypothetical protein